jgi:hypothetical protein
MSMFSDPPAPGDKPHHPLIETAFEGPSAARRMPTVAR